MARVSVALASYNGASFIRAQIQSLFEQTERPFEVVIVDDCSNDNTVEVINSMREKSPFPIRLLENPENIGYIKSFELALKTCTGDFVFLCDQDDIWLPRKIEKVLLQFSSLVQAVTHDVEIFGDVPERGRSLLRLKRLQGQTRASMILGCASCFSRELIEVALPFPPGIVAHDQWLNGLADLLNSRVVVDDVYVKYRRHGGNVSSITKDGEKKESFRAWKAGLYKGEIFQVEMMTARLIERGSSSVCVRAAIARGLRKVGHLRARLDIVSEKRLVKRFVKLVQATNAGVYRKKTGAGMKGALSDSFYAMW